MPEQLPIWRNEGVEPPESLKTSGWEPGMKPSAQHMNWLFNQLAVLAANAGTTIEDILTSTSIENALSANQGRVLNNNLTTLGNQVTQHLAEKTEIIITEENIPPENRKKGSFYFIMTDSAPVSPSPSQNIKVSPSMGIKIMED